MSNPEKIWGVEADALHGGDQAGQPDPSKDGIWPRTEGDIVAEKHVEQALGAQGGGESVDGDDSPLPPAA